MSKGVGYDVTTRLLVFPLENVLYPGRACQEHDPLVKTLPDLIHLNL